MLVKRLPADSLRHRGITRPQKRIRPVERGLGTINVSFFVVHSGCCHSAVTVFCDYSTATLANMQYDVIIIGAGHNGLTTASYIASMLRPTIIKDLKLNSYGLKMVACDPGVADV